MYASNTCAPDESLYWDWGTSAVVVVGPGFSGLLMFSDCECRVLVEICLFSVLEAAACVQATHMRLRGACTGVRGGPWTCLPSSPASSGWPSALPSATTQPSAMPQVSPLHHPSTLLHAALELHSVARSIHNFTPNVLRSLQFTPNSRPPPLSPPHPFRSLFPFRYA